MDYVQERIATLHDFGDAAPDAPTERATVLVPMAERDHGTLAAERVLSTLASLEPGRVVVALRAAPEAVGDVAAWLETFDLPLTVLWCTAPRVESHLAEVGLGGRAGKGRDVWLGLGVAARSEFVVVHDVDAKQYGPGHVTRLLHPVADGFAFSKGFYARVEHGRLYGRLVRLFVRPLLRALREAADAPILRYLEAFRYPLSGEFALTGDLARRVRAQPGWGLELGMLGETFRHAGFERTAQVDLGFHEHDHRAVEGPAGLGDMAGEVGQALFRILEDHGLDLDAGALRDGYLDAADRLVDQYAADATFNGLEYDPDDEREQVTTYADAVAAPGPDHRLPAWADTPVEAETIRSLSADALEAATER